MGLSDGGPALVLVYGNGRREAVLGHAHDGGEAYMGPLLRKAIQYAKTHYESGNIVDILLTEEEMRRLEDNQVLDHAQVNKVHHLYYLTYRYDVERGRKTYHLLANHLKEHHYVIPCDLPEYQTAIPQVCTTLV